jgi:hypothetical protein
MHWAGAKKSSLMLATVGFLLLAMLALPFQGAGEGTVLLSSKIVSAKVKAKPAPAPFKFGILPTVDRPDQRPQIHPSLLRMDLNQNLLVWPNIATYLTRSPPALLESYRRKPVSIRTQSVAV